MSVEGNTLLIQEARDQNGLVRDYKGFRYSSVRRMQPRSAESLYVQHIQQKLQASGYLAAYSTIDCFKWPASE